MIEETLELDKQAKVIAVARMKKQNLFVNYERNPFGEIDGPEKEKNCWEYKERNDFDRNMPKLAH